MKEVVAVVVDQSGSQTIAERPAQTEKAREELQKASTRSAMSKSASSRAGAPIARPTARRLFSALNAGLADVPSERLGGVFMITDGVVDDIPADVTRSASRRRCTR